MRIHAGIAAKLNFAAHQSAFPFLRSLAVENPDAEQQEGFGGNRWSAPGP